VEKKKPLLLRCNLFYKEKLKSNCKVNLNKKTFDYSAVEGKKKLRLCKLKMASILKMADVDKVYIDCVKGKMTKGKGFKAKKEKKDKDSNNAVSDTEITENDDNNNESENYSNNNI